MKNKILLVAFLFSLLIPIHFTFAYVTYSGAPLGSQLNPINITVGGSFGVTYSGAPLGSSLNPIYIKNSPNYNFNTSYKLPNGYKCVFTNISEYERDRIAALKNVETELNKGKTGSSFKGLDYEALYLYKGWLETNFSRYPSNCSNIDSTISSFKSTWSEKVATVLDQVCRESSGINSYYANETDVNKGGGMAGCGCKTGFKFSNGNYGECISISAISEQLKINTPICSTDTVLKNNECISYTKDCRLTFGENVVGAVGPSNNSICTCISGYESKNNWKQGDAQCLPIIKKREIVKITEKTNKKNVSITEQKKDAVLNTNLKLLKTNYQICQEGRLNSNWDGVEVDKNGNLNCPCIVNYRWNKKTENCVEINDQSCKELDPNTKMIITPNNLRGCQCISGYEINKEKNICVTVFLKTINTTESKSFWTRLKGWLGF